MRERHQRRPCTCKSGLEVQDIGVMGSVLEGLGSLGGGEFAVSVQARPGAV
jgi:hypothetical protein